MSKSKQRNKNKSQHHNDSPTRRVVDVGKRPDYHGNSRYIELGTPGIPFRHLINVDHISALRFEEKFEETAEKRSVLVGFDVVITFTSTNNVIGFDDPQQAMNCYNSLVEQIHAVGVPITRLPRLALAPPESESPVIADVDGALISDAINEALLPGDAELTEEELAMLENPEFDTSIETEVEEQALKDTLADSDDPAETH